MYWPILLALTCAKYLYTNLLYSKVQAKTKECITNRGKNSDLFQMECYNQIYRALYSICGTQKM